MLLSHGTLFMLDILSKFKQKRIAVVGDLMLDKYIFGKVDRISPEAPIPIVAVKEERSVPGGAANVATNISTLGAEAFLFGIVGNDSAKDILIKSAHEFGISTEGITIDDSKVTIQKIRVLGQGQQLVRIDYEDQNYAENHAESAILEKIKNIANLDAVIVSDYAKGTINKDFMSLLLPYCKAHNIPVIIDPKPAHKHFYKGAFLVTPNKKEAEEMTGMKVETTEDLEACGKLLIEALDCNVIITTSEKGMSVFAKDQEPVHIPTVAKEVYDVSGAGDTVISTLAIALSCQAALSEAADIANHAAGVKVGKIGTAPVYFNELKKSLTNEL